MSKQVLRCCTLFVNNHTSRRETREGRGGAGEENVIFDGDPENYAVLPLFRVKLFALCSKLFAQAVCTPSNKSMPQNPKSALLRGNLDIHF
jgi:hypothetical protein